MSQTRSPLHLPPPHHLQLLSSLTFNMLFQSCFLSSFFFIASATAQVYPSTGLKPRYLATGTGIPLPSTIPPPHHPTPPQTPTKPPYPPAQPTPPHQQQHQPNALTILTRRSKHQHPLLQRLHLHRHRPRTQQPRTPPLRPPRNTTPPPPPQSRPLGLHSQRRRLTQRQDSTGLIASK